MPRHAILAPLYSLLLMTTACTVTTVSTGAASPGCGGPGANDNGHDVGDEPGGVALDLGEIAVAPSGAYVVFKGARSLLVGWPGDARVGELSLQFPTKLAFSKKRNVVYVGALDKSVHAIDVSSDRELWSTPLGLTGGDGLLFEVSEADDRLLIGSGNTVSLLDTETGEVIADKKFAHAVIDLKILPDDARALVATHEDWPAAAAAPTAELAVLDLTDGQSTSFQVPNCASKLAVTPDGKKAFLSPSFCNKDPISLLDLSPGQEGFVKNLPGFGPLALGPRGATAVAFLDTQSLDASLFDDPAQIPPHGPNDPRYHIMTLDTATLKYQFTAWGDSLPRYQLTPDGRALIVDDPFAAAAEGAARIFDTDTRKIRDISGAKVSLQDFVITDDSKHVYAITDRLLDLDVVEGTARALDTNGFTVTNINVSPDDQTLYLRVNGSTVCIYDVASQACRDLFMKVVIPAKPL